MSVPIDLQNPGRPIRVGVFLTGGLNELLDLAPIDIFHTMDRKFLESFPDQYIPAAVKSQAYEFEFHWIAESVLNPIRLTSGVNLMPTDSFESCPPVDIFLVGATHGDYELNQAELDYLRKAWGECAAFLCICSGVLSPVKAGILEGKTATGPRILIEALQQQAPGVNWVEKRWVRDGKLWTSGMLLNGLDLMTNFCRETWGGLSSTTELILETSAWPDRDVDYKDVTV